MQPNLDILIVTANQQSAERQKISRALNSAAMNHQHCTYQELSQALQTPEHFDTILFSAKDLTSLTQITTCFQLAKKIKANPNTNHIRLLCIELDPNTMPETDDIAFDDILFGTIEPPALLSRIQAQTRLNTIQAELNRRQAIAEIYDCPAQPNPDLQETIENAKILITGRPNGYAILEETLSPISTLIGILSLSTAMDYLKREPFDLLLINGGKMPTRFFQFVETIRQQSTLFNLPILLVAYPDKLKSSHIAYQAGITDILDSPINKTELTLRTKSLIREKRFRTAITKTYLEARHIPTNDALTGLYTFSFYRAHLDQTIKHHKATNRTFTLITLAIENLSIINESHGFAAGDKLLRQVSDILMSVIRGEDLACRISGRKFTLTLPNTTKTHAENVLSRIEGILTQTEFICEINSKPMTLDLSTNILESAGETTAQEFFNSKSAHFRSTGKFLVA